MWTVLALLIGATVAGSDGHAAAYADTPPSVSIWPLPQNLTVSETAKQIPFSSFAFEVHHDSHTSPLVADAVSRAAASLFRRGTPPPTGGAVHVRAIVSVTDPSAETLSLATDESYSLAVVATGATRTKAAVPPNVDAAAPNPAATITISISAYSVYGFMHAIQTLAQIIKYDAIKGQYTVVAPLLVEDHPRFPHRELMLDAARFYLPLPLLRAAVDAMAVVKMNVLHVHATDSESFPLVLQKRPEFNRLAFSDSERYVSG